MGHMGYGGMNKKGREFRSLMMTIARKRGKKRVGGTKFSGMTPPGQFKRGGGA